MVYSGNPMVRNIKLTIEYDGSAYHGWQIQPNGITIQETLESTLARLTGHRPKVIGAGRTDAGVHAEGQVAHFKTESTLECSAVQRGLNALLPGDIVIAAAQEVALEFHARFSARGKTYRYVILNRRHPSAFARDRCWHIPHPLDVVAMQAAAGALRGRHDFSAFQASDCCAGHPRREIRMLEIQQADGQKADGWIHCVVSADAFLKHMVRNIVGTLVDVGRGRWSPEKVAEILQGRDRTRAGQTAPGRGLFLVSVNYP